LIYSCCFVTGMLYAQSNNSIFGGGAEDGHDVRALTITSNNSIFGGGTEDGHAILKFVEASNNSIFAGGDEDGHVESRYVQTSSNSIFGGGDHDGHETSCFIAASNNNIFGGGERDGHGLLCFANPSNNSIFSGGIQDGHSILCFTRQSNNSIFSGGDHDGHSIHCFTRSSNNSIFTGGDFDGHDVGCTTMDPAPLHIGIVYVDSVATGFNDGSSWLHAFTELRTALEFANENPEVDTILIASGTYLPTDGVSRFSSFVIRDHLVILAGFPSGGGDFESRDPAAHPVVLSGDIGITSIPGDNVYHVILIPSTSIGSIVDGVQIKHGLANGFGLYQVGAGILTSGQIGFVNTLFADNAGIGNGSVIFSQGNDAQLSLNAVVLVVSPIGNPLSVMIAGGIADFSDQVTIIHE